MIQFPWNRYPTWPAGGNSQSMPEAFVRKLQSAETALQRFEEFPCAEALHLLSSGAYQLHLNLSRVLGTAARRPGTYPVKMIERCIQRYEELHARSDGIDPPPYPALAEALTEMLLKNQAPLEAMAQKCFKWVRRKSVLTGAENQAKQSHQCRLLHSDQNDILNAWTRCVVALNGEGLNPRGCLTQFERFDSLTEKLRGGGILNLSEVEFFNQDASDRRLQLTALTESRWVGAILPSDVWAD